MANNSSSLSSDARKPIKIRIPHPEDVFNSIFIPLVTDAPQTRKPLIVLEGGRGSGKSKAIAQRLILQSLKSKLRIALIRKVAETIRDSQYHDIRSMVQSWGLSEHFNFIDSRLNIETARGSLFLCKGLDKAEKTKSLSDIDVVWIEEATELTLNDWDTFRFSIRGNDTALKQKILSFNRQAGHWTEKTLFNPDGSFKVNDATYHLHTTFSDNAYLDKPFLADLEELQTQDPELYKKIALGLPVRLQHLIFTNWRECDAFPENCAEVIYGLDFGMSDPTVLVRVGIQGRDLFVDELLYERGKNNQDLRALLPDLIKDKTLDMYADCEDPNRISEIYSDGYNVKPSVKGPNSVIEGIAFLRGFNIHITSRSVNVRKDLENYKWRTDRNGLTVTPEAPMHAFSHGPDAIRYPVFSHLSEPQITEDQMREVTLGELVAVNVSESY